MDSVLSIDQDLVTEAVRTQALETLSAYRSGVAVKWHDAELAIYLIFIYGEINKCMSFSIVHIQLALSESQLVQKGGALFVKLPQYQKKNVK